MARARRGPRPRPASRVRRDAQVERWRRRRPRSPADTEELSTKPPWRSVTRITPSATSSIRSRGVDSVELGGALDLAARARRDAAPERGAGLSGAGGQRSGRRRLVLRPRRAPRARRTRDSRFGRRLVAVCRGPPPPPPSTPGGEHRRRDDEQRGRGPERERRGAQALRRVQLAPAGGLGRVDARAVRRAESPRARAGRAPARTRAAGCGRSSRSATRQVAQLVVLGATAVAGQRGVQRRQRRGSSRDSAPALYAVSWHASLSLPITRCRRVPALVSVVPITAASSALVRPGEELQRDQLALARRQRLERGAHDRAAQAGLGHVVGDAAVRLAAGSAASDGRAPAAPQLVERRVARDAEQPRAGRAARRA